MEPIKSVKERIKELKQEVKIHEEALSVLLRTQSISSANVPEEQLLEKVKDFFQQKSRKEGYQIKEVANALQADPADVSRIIRKFIRDDLYKVNPDAKRFQRFRLKAYKEDSPKKPVSLSKSPKTKAAQKKSSHKFKEGSAKARSGILKKNVRQYLETHQYVNSIKLATFIGDGYTRDNASVLLKKISKEEPTWLSEVGFDLDYNLKPGRNPKRYRSDIYKPPREAVIHAGEGLHEGRKKDPPLRRKDLPPY